MKKTWFLFLAGFMLYNTLNSEAASDKLEKNKNTRLVKDLKQDQDLTKKIYSDDACKSCFYESGFFSQEDLRNKKSDDYKISLDGKENRIVKWLVEGYNFSIEVYEKVNSIENKIEEFSSVNLFGGRLGINFKENNEIKYKGIFYKKEFSSPLELFSFGRKKR